MVRKTGSRRLLNMLTPLSVKSLEIVRPDYIIVVTNNLYDIDLTNSFIQINFPGGSIITEDGVPYTATTDIF